MRFDLVIHSKHLFSKMFSFQFFLSEPFHQLPKKLSKQNVLTVHVVKRVSRPNRDRKIASGSG